MIYVMHENPEWCIPLFEALDALGAPHTEWLLAEGAVPFASEPPSGVFYNRISASSHTRGNLYAPELTLSTLYWLDRADGQARRVINGPGAIHLEISKIAQYHALQKAGARVPDTAAYVGRDNLLAGFARAKTPFILKPNRGGKGFGVGKFDSAAEATEYIDALAPSDAPIDGTWLVQDYIQASEPYITRCEFVAGKFLYAVKVGTAGGFELCPADHCEVPDNPPSFEIIADFDEPDLVKTYQRTMREAGVDIAAFEFIRAADGTIYTYDLNTNTNYNSGAERAANLARGGMGEIARYLKRELDAL